MKRIALLSVLALLIGCQPNDPLIVVLKDSTNPHIRKVMANPDTYELQIIYTQIDSTAGGVAFTDHQFSWKQGQYFYPASTVKLPMALVATEYMQDQGLPLDTPYYLNGDSLLHNVADDIRQILAVSDNAAYNRLYELVGRDAVNQSFADKGLKIRLAHRLSVADAAMAKRDSLGFIKGLDTLWKGGGTDRKLMPKLGQGTIKGKGFVCGDSLVNQPMDFSLKNDYPLDSQHELLKRLFFPEQHSPEHSFQTDLSYLLECMHLPPRKQAYEESEYYDGYVKFLMHGDTQEHMPDHMRQYNKVGYAYGTLTDASYFVDQKNDIRFILSATILVNEDQIFNDDIYEYDTVGIPFLAALGREIYQMELNRK